MQGLTRRRFIVGTVGLIAIPSVSTLASVLTPTPAQTAGPFYPHQFPLDDDNDLTHVQGQDSTARGTITDLTGRLLDVNGRPLPSVRIEIWQCDANGRYHHPRDTGNRPIDAGFQGHGRVRTDAQGRYRFRTIRPVAYPGRTPHIHVAVFPEGESPFITQLYMAGEPRNASDFLFRRVPPDQRHLVVAEFKPVSDGEALLAATWDIVLGGMPRG